MAEFRKLLIVGCGNMGGAMLAGWLAAGINPTRLEVLDPVLPEAPQGVALHRQPPVQSDHDALLLGFKPQQLGAIGPGLKLLAGEGVTVFSLLAGIDPREVQDWYLTVYADAYDWVEMPNVVGMVLYADGGRLATKPYAASGNYINKMSDYCGKCRYKVAQKTGPNACPFNPLYWDFMVRNRAKLESNHRIGRIYGTWDRMAEDKQSEYLESAEKFLDSLVPARKGWARNETGEAPC